MPNDVQSDPTQSEPLQRTPASQVDPGVRRRVRIYALVLVVAAVVVVVDLVRLGAVAWWPTAGCLAVGTVLGVAASRMSHLRWDEPTGRVIARIDLLGGVILAAYVVLVVVRGRLVSLWVDPALVGVCGVAVLAGLMAGQVLGTVGGIARVLGRDVRRRGRAR